MNATEFADFSLIQYQYIGSATQSFWRYNSNASSNVSNSVNINPDLRLMTVLLVLALSACTTTPVEDTGPEPVVQPAPESLPEDPPILENLDISAARTALDAVKTVENEWLIIEPEIAETPVSLSEILAFAQTLHENGEPDKASALARKVLRMAHLGIAQIKSQADATPYYPR